MARNSGKILGYAIAFTAIVTAAILGLSFYLSGSTIHELLTENHKLSKAIRHLSYEEQIGYATLQRRERNESGELVSTVRFVQTASGDSNQIVSEQLFEVVGEVVHFDALIVKFTEDYVKDGKERALYLWRRVYGEHRAPADGESIEIPGSAPERYYNITKALRVRNRDIFWEAIWDLANDPGKLSEYGIAAVFGDAVYLKLESDKLYRFKISATGQIYPEVVDIR
ncbi:MAG: hypothetical protein HRT56_05450 [Coraliomargarita sp.]|nr:hypothetical protein [Coraliomargarita sp.]